MPAQPAWFSRLDQILAELKGLDVEFLDRHAFETLFQVRPRRAQQLMATLGIPITVGQAAAVRPSDLAVSLQALAAGEAVSKSLQRRRRVREAVEQARAETAARAIPVTPAPSDVLASLLPPGIDLSPGHLHLTFRDVDELWAQLDVLVTAAVRDRRAFLELASPEAGP